MNTLRVLEDLAGNTHSPSSSAAPRRSFVARGLHAVLTGLLFAGCTAAPESTDSDGPAESTAEQGPGATGAAFEANPAELVDDAQTVIRDGRCPSPEVFLEAGDCADCTVLRVGRVDLPMTGAGACTAKILDASGQGSLLTLTDDGGVADEAELLRRERDSYTQRHGALTPELAAALENATEDDLFTVWIWTRVTLEYPPKEALIADPALARRFAEEASRKAEAARAPVKAELARRGIEITEEDGVTPLLRAVMPASAARELARMPGIVALGADEGWGRPLSTAWYQTSRADIASWFATGSGQGVCLIEAGRPDDTSQLELAGTAAPAPGGAAAWHIRLTSGIVRNTSTIESAPGASIYIGNWAGYTPTIAAPSVHQWCMNQGVNTMNFSWSFSDGSAGGLNGVDMQFDYLAKLWPYPLYVPASGNSGCVASYDTVMNRGFNSLVVGGSNDQGDTDVTNDTIYDCSSWRNPTSAHGDRELPYMVAPAVNVDAVGTGGTGTSLAAPQASGIAAIMASRSSTFAGWPEVKRAGILATSVRSVDGAAITNLPAGDVKDGVGALNGYLAAHLADPTHQRAPNSTAAMYGYQGMTLNFTYDFTGNVGNPKWNMVAGSSGRLRAAIAWDGSATCQSDGSACTGDTIDGDLDLLVFDSVTGALVCSSTTYDSSWEVCDFAPVANRQYRAELRKYSTTAASTYLGVAWYAYDPVYN